MVIVRGAQGNDLKLPVPYALLVGASPDAPSRGLVQSLAGGADLVIAVDGGFDRCLDAGIPVDVVVGDFDSVSGPVGEQVTVDGIVRVPSEKDFTDCQLGCRVATDRGYGALVLAGFTGGRLDHQLAVLGACLEHGTCRVFLVDDTMHATLLMPGPYGTLATAALGAGCGHVFSTIAVREDTVLEVVGAKYPACDLPLPLLGGIGISNVAVASDCRVRCRSGAVLLIVPFEA